MYEVKVESRFRASHAIASPNGELEPCHSHDWEVAVVFSGSQLRDHGVLVDFVTVRERLDEILRSLDGVNLNEHPFLERLPSTAENIACRIYELLNSNDWQRNKLSKVIVREAHGCTASYVPE